MATQVSPGIVITEIDKSLTLAQVALTDGGFAGPFRWGPVDQLVTVTSEQELVQRFYTPNNNTAEYFFTAANFLGYSRSLRVVRAVSHDANGDITAYNASADGYRDDVVLNEEDYEKKSDADKADFGLWLAKYPGSLGNGLRVEICDSANGYSSTPATKVIAVAGTTTVYTENTSATTTAFLQVGDTVIVGGAKRTVTALGSGNTSFTVNVAFTSAVANLSTLSAFTFNVNTTNTIATVTGGDISALVGTNGRLLLVSGANVSLVTVASSNTSAVTLTSNAPFTNTAAVAYAPNTFTRQWRYARLFDSAPGTSEYAKGVGKANAHDEMHIVVVDTIGSFGPPNTVLERFAYVSKARDGKTNNNLSNYYREVVNRVSPYIWWGDHPNSTATSNTVLAWGDSLTESATDAATANSDISFEAANTNLTTTSLLNNGSDGTVVAGSDLLLAYDHFKKEDAEISFLLGGPVSASIASTLIADIIEPKKYVVGFFSPDRDDVVNNVGSEVEDIIAYRNSLPSTSYAVLDTGWKYQYDKYNGVFRWVPLNGDVAGCLVRTDGQAESWFSPAGFTRGQIKNVVKLAFNPNLTQRDDLYRNGINPVVTFPGQGTVLFGDKTLLARPSAFDRINVRRLFIVLEKTIEQSAKQQLFEQNDEFTRNAFINLVEPFLRSVRGRRGITDFYVVCDETNNPQDAIDRNEFRADIFIKPTRSINFIQLNFTAVRSDVAFSEVVTNLG